MRQLLPPAQLIKEGGWVAAGQVGVLVGRLVGVRLLTTILAPAAFGEFVLLQGVASLGIGTLCGPLFLAAQRFRPEAAQVGLVGSLRRLLSRLLNASVAAIVCLIVGGGLVWSATTDATHAILFLALVPLVPLEAHRQLRSALLNAARRRASAAKLNTLDGFAKPIAGAAFALAFARSAPAVLLGFAAGTVLTLLVYRFAVPMEQDAADTPHAGDRLTALRHDLVRFALPLAPLALLNWVTALSDRYILGALTGPEVTGGYAAAYALGSVPFLSLGRVIAATMRPPLFEAVARGDTRRTRRLFVTWLALVAIGAAGGALALAWSADWVTALLLGPAFRGSARLLPWIAAAYALVSVQQVLETAFHARRTTHRLTIVQAITAVAAVALYLLLIPSHGAAGAAAATLIACATSMLLTAALAELPQFLR